MKINLVRIDERLNHGQVMSSWVKRCWIKHIILVDDEYVNDEFMKTILPMSAPAGTKVEIRETSDTAILLNSDHSDESTMLLFRKLEYAYRLYQCGYHFTEINIGNIGSAADRHPVTKKVYMSEAEKEICRELCRQGVRIYMQELPHDSEVDVMSKI